MLAALAVGGASCGVICAVQRGSTGVLAPSERRPGQVSKNLPLGPHCSTAKRIPGESTPLHSFIGPHQRIWSLVLVWLSCPVTDDPGGVAARSPGRALTADRDVA